ncbi:unnamed protein product [Cuscuta campestris]|uniref:F-box domain-containing protein n=1 Tax=Cuscuta campestris TaxID=132261 RepID=A0A484K9P4_9ASTE|nr:unnamed protein product [Cuscuta campestris]
MDCWNTHVKDGESGSSLNRFLELPEDVIANILHRLGAYEILENAQGVCSSWRNICKDPSMWRVIDMKHLSDEDEYLEAMCREAVDRSQGQLTELHIDRFATDQLLLYISERSSKLRCLEIRDCYEVGDDGLIEAAKKFPLLEELHFVSILGVVDSIEPIGQSCPKLKSFTLSSSEYKHGAMFENDDFCINFQAVAIARSMPGLRHLRVLGSAMTNKGLEAILDGCPNLKSLDIRRCFKVDLRGEIGDRIAQKIKDFKCLNDPMEEGCDWDADIFYYEDYSDGWSSPRSYSCIDSPDDSTDDYAFRDSIEEFDFSDSIEELDFFCRGNDYLD